MAERPGESATTIADQALAILRADPLEWYTTFNLADVLHLTKPQVSSALHRHWHKQGALHHQGSLLRARDSLGTSWCWDGHIGSSDGEADRG